jgi:uncharacterized Tic20 family protein
MRSNKILEAILPYLYLGITIALMIGFLIILSYVFIWGILIGFIIYIGVFIKERFFSKNKTVTNKKKHKGRVIDHDDVK